MTGAGSIHPHPTIVGWGFLLGNDKGVSGKIGNGITYVFVL